MSYLWEKDVDEDKATTSHLHTQKGRERQTNTLTHKRKEMKNRGDENWG